jgi:surface antigen
MSAKRLVLNSAAVTMAATFLFGIPNAAAFAQDNAGVSIDFPVRAIGDDVDWTAVAEAFGMKGPNGFKNQLGFAIGRVADARGMSAKDLVRDLNRSKKVNVDGEWLRKQAPIAGYSVNDTAAIGSIAYFAKGTEFDLTIGDGQYSMKLDNGPLYAYVAAVNGDGTLTLEYFNGSHRSYTVQADSVTDFLHLAKSSLPPVPPAPTDWLTDAAPSTPGVARDIATDPGLRLHYPVRDLAPIFGIPADADEATLDARIRQCGTYAEWLISRYLGITRSELTQRIEQHRDINGVTTQSGNADSMDEMYSDLGVRVDKTPAVGSIATWDHGDELMGTKFGETGHAAMVTRVYRLLASDKAEADALAESEYVDGVTLKRLVDKANASSAPKLTYVLLEDYNGFGNTPEHASQYGQKVMPADWVDHYIHLASSPLVSPLTPSERLDQYVATHPKMVEALGEPTGAADQVENTKITRAFANGTVSFDTQSLEYSAEYLPTTPELEAAIEAERQNGNWQSAKTVPTPTAQERLVKQVKEMGEVLRHITAKLAGRKPNVDLAAKLANLTQQFTQLQQQLANEQSS